MITSGLSMIGPWPGSSRRGARSRTQAQRLQVLPQVAAVARGNDDRPADAHQIAAEQVSRGLVEEAQMIRRVARRVNRQELRVARRDGTVRPLAESHDARGRPARRERREPADVIRVAVRDQHRRERRALERRRHRIEVRLVADTRVDEHRHAPRAAGRCCCRSVRSRPTGCGRAVAEDPCLKF